MYLNMGLITMLEKEGEIMELATPDDEVEESSESGTDDERE